MTTYVPLNTMIIVKPVKKEEAKSVGGIYIASNSAEAERLEHLLTGEVIAVSANVTEVNIGDKITYVKAAHCPIPNTELGAIKLEHVVAIVKEN